MKFETIKKATEAVWEGEPDDRREFLNDLEDKLFPPNIKTLKRPPAQMQEHQELVDAIMDCIDDFSEGCPVSNIVVYGALEIVKHNYFSTEE